MLLVRDFGLLSRGDSALLQWPAECRGQSAKSKDMDDRGDPNEIKDKGDWTKGDRPSYNPNFMSGRSRT